MGECAVLRDGGGCWGRGPNVTREEGPRTLLGGKDRPSEGQRCSFCPVLLNGQVPLPGEVVMLVIVGEEGLVVVSASGQHALGGLLNWSQKLIFLWPRPVAAHHERCFIHWEERKVH